MSTAIITGAAGFIGSHLAAALLEYGWRVVGIDNFDPFYSRAEKEDNLAALASNPRFELHTVDIRDDGALMRLARRAKPCAVFHLAALAGVRPSIYEPARFIDVNVNGTGVVLEMARHAGCGVVVFASSSSVYGNNEKVPFAEQDHVDEPISPYAATKRAGELLCHTYARLYGLRIACLRFFTVYGPAQRPDLAIMKFMRRIAVGEPVEMFGDGSTSRDYTYIDDIINGVIAAHDRIAKGNEPLRTWNLGNSRPIRLRDMIHAISLTVGREALIEPRLMQPGDVERTWADLSRSRVELAYEPRTQFEEGLRRQWAWLQSRLTRCERTSPVTTQPS